MSDHEHDFWRTESGTLTCACGASRHPVLEEKMQAIAPFVADQPRPPHREDEVRSSGWTNQ